MIYLWTGLEVVAVDVTLAVVLLLLARRGLKRSGLGAMLAAARPPAKRSPVVERIERATR